MCKLHLYVTPSVHPSPVLFLVLCSELYPGSCICTHAIYAALPTFTKIAAAMELRNIICNQSICAYYALLMDRTFEFAIDWPRWALISWTQYSFVCLVADEGLRGASPDQLIN